MKQLCMMPVVSLFLEGVLMRNFKISNVWNFNYYARFSNF